MNDRQKLMAAARAAQRRLTEPGVVTFAAMQTIDLALVMASGKEVTRAVSAEWAASSEVAS